MATGIEFLVTGIALGLAAGLSPGPLLTLAISETLKSGRGEGFKVAFSPLITDSLIILFALVILTSIATDRIVVSAISLLGAAFLTYLGVTNLRVKIQEFEAKPVVGKALVRGVVTNLLNPSTYMFWLTIGGPTILESAQVHISATFLFILGFYVALIGSNVTVVMVVGKSKNLVRSKYYSYVIRALGIVLIVFAVSFIVNFLELIGLL
jgi:threonine/homoserine/homoserine lactone efflux protein